MNIKVTVKPTETLDQTLQRLKNKLEAEGVLEELRRLRAFENKAQKRKRKARSNARKAKRGPGIIRTAAGVEY